MHVLWPNCAKPLATQAGAQTSAPCSKKTMQHRNQDARENKVQTPPQCTFYFKFSYFKDSLSQEEKNNAGFPESSIQVTSQIQSYNRLTSPLQLSLHNKPRFPMPPTRFKGCHYLLQLLSFQALIFRVLLLHHSFY